MSFSKCKGDMGGTDNLICILFCLDGCSCPGGSVILIIDKRYSFCRILIQIIICYNMRYGQGNREQANYFLTKLIHIMHLAGVCEIIMLTLHIVVCTLHNLNAVH